MSYAVQGQSRQMGHSEEFWQNVVHWRREWQTTPVFLPWEAHEQYDKKKDKMPEDEPPRLEGVQYTPGEEQREITNSSRKKEVSGPKQKWHSVVYVFSGESKVQCCEEQYCIGT